MAWRVALARTVGHLLPPLLAPRITARICPTASGPFVARVRTGSRYAGHHDDYHAHFLALHGFYDWRLCVVAATACRRGDVVAEVGANVGTETVVLADLVGPTGHVVAFEPFGPNVRALQEALVFSAPGTAVTIEPVAVSDRPGPIAFAPPPPGESGVGYVGAGTGYVDAVRLDDYPFRGPLRFLAIDAEGHELVILRGSAARLARDRPVIVLEAAAPHLARAGDSMEALKDWLEAHSYVVRRIGRWGLGPVNTRETADPGNWVAVPELQAPLLATMHWRLRGQALSPVWIW